MSEQHKVKWPKVRLGDHTTVKARLGWKGLKAEEYIHDGPIFLAAPNLRRGWIDFDNVDHIPQWRYDESPEIRLNEGDVLLVKDGSTLGISSLVRRLPGQTTVNGSIAVIRPNSSLDSGYLFYCINGRDFQQLVWLKRSGLGVPHLFQADLREFEIALPHQAEQRRIAEILSTVDGAIEQTEALITKYQQIKAGLMQDLFTRGLTPDGHLRPTHKQAPHLYKESPLGWIPKEWEIACISDVFEIQLGKMLNKLAKTGKLSAPYLGNRAVQWDFVDCTAVEVIDFTASERLKFMLVPGDLLVCEGGDVGRTALWRGEIDGCYYQKALHRLRPKSDHVLPTFMLRFMKFARDNGSFREFTSQSSIAHLTQEKLGSISTILPASNEQRRIADRFDAIDGLIQLEQSKLAKLRQQKQGLMQDLLTGRVRVKVADPVSR